MGWNTLTLTAEYITDTLSKVKPSTDDDDCETFFTNTLSKTNPPYTAYNFQLASMATLDLSPCDTSSDPNASCISQVLLRYGSRAVSSISSKHGVDATEMLTDAAAIAGAVQFFMWFLSIFTI